MYANILVAYDGSKEADRALNQGIMLCQEHPESKLEVIHVYNIPNVIFGEAMVAAPPRVEQEFYEYAQKVVEKAKHLVSIVPHASVTMLEGNPARTILERAKEAQSDLIIIGSRGLGGLSEFVLGSVSHHVVQHSPIPVLIIK